METLGLINPLQDIHGQKGKVIEDNLSSKPNNIKLNGTKHLQRFVTETLQDHVSSAKTKYKHSKPIFTNAKHSDLESWKK